MIWRGYDTAPKTLVMTNTGSTVSITGTWVDGKPHVSGGPLNGIYLFSQIHFHCPSEHSLDDKRFPLEIHAVHYKASYMTEERAMKECDGTIVLVYLFETVRGESPMSNITKNLSLIRKRNGKARILYTCLEDFVRPFNGNYYVYSGTADLGDAVYHLQWIISCNKLRISEKELADLIEFFRGTECDRSSKSRECNPIWGGLFFVGETVHGARGSRSDHRFSDAYPSESDQPRRERTDSTLMLKLKKLVKERNKSRESLHGRSSSDRSRSSSDNRLDEKPVHYVEDTETNDSPRENYQKRDPSTRHWVSDSSDVSDSTSPKRKFLNKFPLGRKNSQSKNRAPNTKYKKKKKKKKLELMRSSSSSTALGFDGERDNYCVGGNTGGRLSPEKSLTCVNCSSASNESELSKNAKKYHHDRRRPDAKGHDRRSNASGRNSVRKDNVSHRPKNAEKGHPRYPQEKPVLPEQSPSVKWHDHVEVRIIDVENANKRPLARLQERPTPTASTSTGTTTSAGPSSDKSNKLLRVIKEDPIITRNPSTDSFDDCRIVDRKRGFIVAPATVTDSASFFKTIGTMTNLSLIPIGETAVQDSTAQTKDLVLPNNPGLKTEKENGVKESEKQKPGPRGQSSDSKNVLKPADIPKEEVKKPTKSFGDASTSTDNERIIEPTKVEKATKMTPDPSPVNVPPPTINLNSGSQTSPRKEQSLASIFTAISEDISLNSILNKISGVGSQMSLSSVMGVKKGGKPTNPPQQPEPVSHPPSMSLSSKKTDVYSRLAQAASQVSKELRLMESHCQKDGKVKASLRDLPRAMEENRCKEKQDRPFDQGNEKMSDLSFGEAIGIDKKLSPSSMALRNRRYSNNHTLVNFLVKLSKEPSLAADLAAFLGGGGNKPRKSRKEESLSSILTKVAKDPSFATDLAIILSESSLAESLHDGSYQKIPEIDTSSRSDERSKSTNEVSGSDNSSKMSSEVCFNYKKPGKKNVVLVTEKDRGPPSGNYRDKYLDYQIYPVRNNGPPLTGASKYGHDKPLPVKTKSSPVSLPQKDISTTDTSDGESNPSENSTIDLNSSKSDSKKSLNDSSNDLAERSSDESKDPASEDSERASDEQLLADDLARLLKANSQGKSDDAKAREEPVSSDDPLKVKSLLDILRKVSREPSLSTALVNVLTKRSSVTFKNAAEGKTPQKVEDSQNRTRKGTSGKLITSQSGTSTSSKKSHPSETDKKKEGATPSQPLLVSAIMNASPRVPSSASDLDKSKESLYSAYDDKTESEKAQPAPITEKRTFGSLGECIAEILARVTGERGLLTDFTKIASTKHQSVASIFDRVSKGNSQSSVSSNIRKKLSLPGDLGKVDGENRNSADSNYDSDDTDRMEKDTSQPEGENIGRRLQGRVNFEADPARSEIDTERPEVETLHRQEDLNESIKSRRSTDTRRSGDDEISSDLCKKPGTDEDGQLKLVRSGKVDVSDASFFEEYYLRVEEHEAVVQEYAGTFDPAESNSNTVRLSLCPKASIISNDQNIILEDCIVRFDVKDNSEKVCVETHFLVTSGSSTRDFASNQSLEEDRIKKVEDVSEEKKSETSTGSKKQLFFDSESIEYDPETGKKVIVGRFVTDP